MPGAKRVFQAVAGAGVRVIYGMVEPVFTLRLHWASQRHPVFRVELRRRVGWPAVRAQASKWPAARLIARPLKLLGLVFRAPYAFAVVLVVFFVVPSVVLVAMAAVVSVFALPFVPWFWRVPTVLSAAVTMSREIECRRLAMLRSTLFSTREIVLALLAAGTYRVERLWFYVLIMRVIFGDMVMIPMTLNLSMLWGSGATIFGVMVMVLSYLYLLAEPVLDVAVDGAWSALGATYGHSQVSAMLNSMILRVGLWALQVLGLLVMLPLARDLLPEVGAEEVVWLTLLGPSYGMIVGLSPGLVLVLLAAVVLFRLAVLRGVLWLAIWRVEALAV